MRSTVLSFVLLLLEYAWTFRVKELPGILCMCLVGAEAALGVLKYASWPLTIDRVTGNAATHQESLHRFRVKWTGQESSRAYRR